MRVRIKICGITNPADAELAASLGADAIGLNFYAGSPRCISEETAWSILAVLPPFVEPVAVVVNESRADMRQRAHLLHIRTVQVHGDHLHRLPACEIRWVPAFAIAAEAGLAAMQETLARLESPPAAILVDAHVPGMHGGTGQTAPWHLLAEFKPGVPLILAGGLTPENVVEAIRIVRPYAVDGASGIESAPGKKDPEKLRRFIDAVRSA